MEINGDKGHLGGDRGGRRPPCEPLRASRGWSQSTRRSPLIADDVAAEATVDAVCATHQIGLTWLYPHPRRPPDSPPPAPRRQTAQAAPGAHPARLHQRRRRRRDRPSHLVAPSTVSSLAVRHGISRVQQYTRDELVDLVVRYLVGDEPNHERYEAIPRVGCRTQLPGLRTVTTTSAWRSLGRGGASDQCAASTY